MLSSRYFLMILLILLAGIIRAQDHIETLEEKIQTLPDNREKVDDLIELGKYLQASKTQRSIKTFEEAIQIADRISYDLGVTSAVRGIAVTYFIAGREVRAIESLEDRLTHLRSQNDHVSLQEYYLLLAQLYGKQKDLIGLRKYQNLYLNLQDSLTKAEADQEISVLEQQVEEEKSVALEAVSDKDEALEALQQQEQIALQRQLEIARLEAQTAELERLNAEKESARLAKENEAIQLEIELNRKLQNRNRIIVIAGVLLLLFGVLIQRYRLIQARRKVAFEQQKAERLEQIDRLKDQFLANTSHELRTPLNGIIGIAEGLYDGVHQDNPAQYKRNLGMIISSGKRLSNLVNDLLDFSKIRNDELKLNIKAVDVRTLTEVVLAVSRSHANAKGLNLENKVPGTIAAVSGDEDRLQQILFNLIDNAIKFSNEGSITVSAEEKEGLVEISVTDEGLGMDESKLESIFEEFTQLDGSTDRQHSGTGLGLSITSKLVELHKGSIDVQSTPGKGSIFRFTIPVSEEPVIPAVFHHQVSSVVSYDQGNLVETKPAVTVTSKDESKIRILIVDDEPINQQVLRNHLSNTHYQISTAMDGKQAIKRIEEEDKFDLVLLDIMMPNMTGYSVCQQIRKKYLASELPIIMITAKNQVSDLVEALAYGANDYLAKPFSKDEFLARIKTHLDLYSINSATTRFVPSEFLRSLGYETITDVRLGDYQQKDVTVFFSDIRSYTTMSESMSPEQNFKFVGAYVNRMGPIIKRFEGFVLQYLGDGIMALFLDSPDKAVHAAVTMQKRIDKYNQERIEVDRKAIKVGMGLHTGPLIMGIIGDSTRNDPATISDAVNIASRMEGLTRIFDASILITRSTMDRLIHPEQFSHRYLGKVMTKGKKELVEVFEIIDGESSEQLQLKIQTREIFEAGIHSFLAREYQEAQGHFSQVLKKNTKDIAARYYLQEINSLVQVENNLS